MRKTKFLEGEYYHIYNRGALRSEIFLEDEDCLRFQHLLYLCNSENSFNYRDDFKILNLDPYDFERGEKLVNICAYVLMPNHFHLFLHIPKNTLNQVKGKPYRIKKIMENPLPTFMMKLTRAYSRYFNNKYEKGGVLFEGSFKSEHITNDQYYKYLFSYIALNPLKLLKSNWREVGFENIEKANNFLNDYKHSSFIDYFLETDRPQSKLLDKNIFLNMLDKNTDLSLEILEWIRYTEKSKHSENIF
jgi:REP element-mobilizing transposase RayT